MNLKKYWWKKHNRKDRKVLIKDMNLTIDCKCHPVMRLIFLVIGM